MSSLLGGPVKSIFLIFMLSVSAQAEVLMECVPKSENLPLAEDEHYVTYSIYQEEGDENFLFLRKTYLSQTEEASVERRMFRAAFDWRPGKEPGQFSLAYATPGVTFVLKGKLRPENKPSASHNLSDSRIISLIDQEKSPVGSALSTSGKIASWTCLLKDSVLSQLKRQKPGQ